MCVVTFSKFVYLLLDIKIRTQNNQNDQRNDLFILKIRSLQNLLIYLGNTNTFVIFVQTVSGNAKSVSKSILFKTLDDKKKEIQEESW